MVLASIDCRDNIALWVALDSLPCGVLVTDSRNRIMYLNSVLSDMLGLEDRDDISDSKLTSLFNDKCLLCAISSVDGQGITWNVSPGLVTSGSEVQGDVSDERQKPMLEALTKEMVFCGEPAWLTIFKDITSLKNAEAKINELSARLLNAKEEERTAIGHELHDEVGSLLTALKLMLNRIDPIADERGSDRRDQLNALLDQTIDTVSNFTHAMRTEILDEMGLFQALELHLQEYTRQTGIQVNHVWQGSREKLLSLVETAIYRIVQEALTNTARYAHTDTVSVTVSVNSQKLHIQVEDRGCGFDPGKIAAESSGIAGMQERATLCGGELIVNTSPGEGTCVICTLPLLNKNDICDSMGPD